jgi:hypothetical protein
MMDPICSTDLQGSGPSYGHNEKSAAGHEMQWVWGPQGGGAVGNLAETPVRDSVKGSAFARRADPFKT